jgi:hypothetical protein
MSRAIAALGLCVLLAAGCHATTAGEEDTALAGDVRAEDAGLDDVAPDPGSADVPAAADTSGGETAPDVAAGTDAAEAVEDLAAVDTAPYTCDSMGDKNCFELQRGESHYFRKLDTYETQVFDDKGNDRVVVRLQDLVDSEVAEDPAAWRFQVFGTDGYTFGGFATWVNVQNGYIELGTRKVVWEPSQELPDSWRVKDAYLMVLSPAGGGQ